MKRTLTRILFVLLFMGALSLTLFTRVEKANAEVASGNRAFAAQDFETALLHYTKAQTRSTGEPEPLYNAASVHYRQQAMDQAQQFLEQALALPDKAIEEFIHYNLGNVAYQAQQFDAAITEYESALRIDPADQEAKYNLELALLQQQNQQQDQQQNQQQNQQQQDQQNQQDQNQQNQQGQQPGQSDPTNGQAAGGQPQQGLTADQARQLLAAIAGDSKSLLEKLQMYYNIQGSTPEKDW